jgi:hypothetical protein
MDSAGFPDLTALSPEELQHLVDAFDVPGDSV